MKRPSEVDRFLACKRIAFVGVSKNPDDFSRMVFREFVLHGYEVIPVRPDGAEVEGLPSFTHVQQIPGEIDGAFVMTPGQVSERVVRDCAVAGIRKVWLHRGGGPGSVTPDAVQFCHRHGIEVVAGECPMMFLPNAAWIHRVHGEIRSLFR